jgi:broad specificity phosphatase PhoE
MAPSTALLLIRHGHTAENGAGMGVRMSGWTDTPLSAEGLRQARAVAAQLARESPSAVVFSSPLQRARMTAELIADAIKASLRIDRGLCEINCGAADGLPLSEVEQRYPNYWAGNLRQSDPDFRWPDGESYNELRARVLSAVQRMVRWTTRGARITVVTHAGFISQLLGSIYGVSPARWDLFRPRNGSITELAFGDRTQVVRYDAMPRNDAFGQEHEQDVSVRLPV